MSDMKCPFCQQELVREGSDNYWCKKCNLEMHSPALYGSQKMWQELIRTRKALDVAKDWLEQVATPAKCDDELCREFTKRKLSEIKRITETKE